MPHWLVLLVLALLLAVVALSGYLLVRWTTTGSLVGDSAHSEIDRLKAEVLADPNDVDARVSLGYAYQEEGRLEEAVTAYDDAIAMDGGNLGALYNRGACLVELDRVKEAEASFVAVIELAPGHALAAKALGDYYVSTKQYEKIPAAVEQAAVANPEMADLRVLLGIAYEKAGRAEEAAVEYRRALELAPEIVEAKQGLERVEGGSK